MKPHHHVLPILPLGSRTLLPWWHWQCRSPHKCCAKVGASWVRTGRERRKNRGFMGNSWGIHGEFMGISWGFHGDFMGMISWNFMWFVGHSFWKWGIEAPKWLLKKREIWEHDDTLCVIFGYIIFRQSHKYGKHLRSEQTFVATSRVFEPNERMWLKLKMWEVGCIYLVEF